MSVASALSPVSPELEELIGLRNSVGRIVLASGKIKSNRVGMHASRIKGRGMAFEESRPYQPGDDMRNFDWNVTARTGKPFTKVFSEEKERPVIFWMDYRQPMFFATRGQFKSALATRAAALLAWVALREHDRIGGLLFNETRHHELRPAGGRKAALHLLHQMQSFAQFDQQRPQYDSDTQQQVVEQALLRLRKAVHPGSLVFLFSDFRLFNGHHQKHLTSLSRHNQLVFLPVSDPFESQLPPPGQYPVQQSGQRFALDTRNKNTRRHYHQLWQQQRQQLDELISLCRGIRIDLSTQDDIESRLSEELGR
ncbi:MAG: DUF58 domain-containing protein [gamma proteobacterium symbiont of Bathyaustriella thionipta]|nr:DUF58 domain-containing protein [gamma proteobacterium symbiont of Bathyaustriella thionipta]